MEKDLSGNKSLTNRMRGWLKDNSESISRLGTAVGGLTGVPQFATIGGVVVDMLQKREDVLSELRKLLEEEVIPATTEIEGEVLPLVVLVDELDRCRPLHAIAMLERIKHVFQVPGITFVLSIDKTNLKRSIQSVYGQIDADDYLRRFFTFEHHLPQISSPPFVSALFPEVQLATSDVVPTLLLASGLSLRSMQRVATGINLVRKSGLFSDAFTIGNSSQLFKDAQSLYQQRHQLGNLHSGEYTERSTLQQRFAEGSAADNPESGCFFREFFLYQDDPSNLAHFIQDFAWGIVAWNILLKPGIGWQPQDGSVSFMRAAQQQTYSWEIESASKTDDPQRVLDCKRREECGDEYYMDTLAWTCYMTLFCAQLIERHKFTWLNMRNVELWLVRQIWLRAGPHFIDNSKEITLSTRSGTVTPDKWNQPHFYRGSLKVFFKSKKEINDELAKTKQDIAFKALAAATVAIVKACQVMHDNPGLFGEINGNNQDE